MKSTDAFREGNFRKAADAIGPHIIKTPLVYAPLLSQELGTEIYLKLENLQKTGSFKIRGASLKLHNNLNKIGDAGVVAASAGNHAQGVALAASQAGIQSTIVMPRWASISKQMATRSYGGEVILSGNTVEESLNLATEISSQGKLFIHPFDDPDVILGQGTIALEILDEMPDVDNIVIPVGGGGLLSGICAAAKSIKPSIKVSGVQAEACPSAVVSLQSRSIVKVEALPSIADGISVKQPGRLTFDLMSRFADDMVTADEESIAAAILMLLEKKKILAEGSGAVPLAALLQGSLSLSGSSKTVLLVSGGNVDSPLLGRIINKGLIRHNRLMHIGVRLSDVPGSLSGLLGEIADLEANVLHIYHDRNFSDIPIYSTRVDLELEIRGKEHFESIVTRLRDIGYEIDLRESPQN